jgi:hypothetical protein
MIIASFEVDAKIDDKNLNNKATITFEYTSKGDVVEIWLGSTKIAVVSALKLIKGMKNIESAQKLEGKQYEFD